MKMDNLDISCHSISIAVLTAIALTASACGGGGGGTVQSTGTATVPAPAGNSSPISSPPYSSFNDQLSLYLSQPLRIEDGTGQLRVASGRTIDRQVIYQDLHFDLQPQGREQQLELNYHRPWQLAQKAAWLSASASYIYQPGHSDLRPSQLEMRVAVSIAID